MNLKIFNELTFIKKSENLKGTLRSISFRENTPIRDDYRLGIQYERVVLDSICDDIYKTIFDRLSSSSKTDFLDLRSKDHIFNYFNSDKIFYKILSHDYKNVIISVSNCDHVYAHRYFESNPIKNVISSSYFPYKVGTINDISFWIDPRLKYNDERFFLFNDININFSFKDECKKMDHFGVIETNTRYMLDVPDNDGMILHIITSDNSIYLSTYLSKLRDQKIDLLTN